MEVPGDEFDCPHCDTTHVVKEDDKGFSTTVMYRKLYVECPKYDGVVVWAVTPDATEEQSP